MKVGIIVAMSREYTHIESLMSSRTEHKTRLFDYIEGEIAGNTIIMMQCGIGKVNSALGAAEMISKFSPDCVISSGVAGGIDSSLNVMDMVVSNRCCYHDVWCGEGNEQGQVQGLSLYFESCQAIYDIALALESESESGHQIHKGLVVSGDQFITNREELNKIKQAHPAALSVDMESCSIAQCCHLYGVPFVSVRVISDTPGACENHTEQYENFWGEIASCSFTTLERLLKSLPQNI